MGHTSKDLLHLEHKNPSTSPLESTLLVCRKDIAPLPQKSIPDGNPITAPVPKSQVLGKIKDFLGVISEANERLQHDAKENSESYDIESLTGNETEIIEMDLMLGIADLHTPEAVAAAESAIAGYQPLNPLAASSSGTISDDSSDNDSDDDNDDDDDDDDENDNDDGNDTCLPLKLERSKSGQGNSLSEDVNPSKKRQKIVELS
ncbi:uncharacterized protein LOC126706162 [Quercus robur]|uniref:uncharacterized protein LOC126706162 n=1 Tax=Quercus robur TaxID=38942 RepID=UPI002162AC40|nr:uncharacterized protein LOC126706162 [Quercus robur]XP_050261431.1 uncharacterized protein LOC126706162 [Quercus robur]XP_050261432.1 uncharacterized protein LOC126706162 [Quercus robur]XP_050261433.1 uncharacterized protein LOC126706162 [Quercus robur]